MVVEIYYFSGTGNSLYVAKELQNKIPGLRLIPIAALFNKRLNERNKNIKSTSETIGFVFPCHGLTIPIPVKKCLKILDLTSSKYLFAIATRGGSIFRGFSTIDKVLNKQGKTIPIVFAVVSIFLFVFFDLLFKSATIGISFESRIRFCNSLAT